MGENTRAPSLQERDGALSFFQKLQKGDGMIAKGILMGLLAVVVSAGGLWAEEKPSAFFRNNAIAIKGGYHFYVDSDFTDFWQVKKKDYNGFAFELAYERELIKYLGLETALGYHKAHTKYSHTNLVYSGDRSAMETTLENVYLSLSLKPHIPLGSSFQVYLGAGGDFYYAHSKMEGDYQRGGTYIYINRTEENFAFGFHGLAGIEVLLLKDPAKFGVADMPMSLFLEYKYSHVMVDDTDERVVKDINSAVGSSLDSHDLNVGGHLVFLGLRWRF